MGTITIGNIRFICVVETIDGRFIYLEGFPIKKTTNKQNTNRLDACVKEKLRCKCSDR